MRRTCITCEVSFDDEFRTTICPHGTFLANDGENNFRYHDESPLIRPDPEWGWVVGVLTLALCLSALAIFLWVHR